LRHWRRKYYMGVQGRGGGGGCKGIAYLESVSMKTGLSLQCHTMPTGECQAMGDQQHWREAAAGGKLQPGGGGGGGRPLVGHLEGGGPDEGTPEVSHQAACGRGRPLRTAARTPPSQGVVGVTRRRGNGPSSCLRNLEAIALRAHLNLCSRLWDAPGGPCSLTS